nr:hypothetical protein [uncultured Prevotella sp.]DAV55051.1 MAG TPA: hypothetical protein [Caudoviricetes sp.]
MKQTYYVVEPFEIYSQEQLTKKVQSQLASRGSHVIAMVFDCSSSKECSDRYFKQIGV